MADTDVRLSVDLDVADAEKTAEQLHKEIQKVFQSRNGEQSASLTQLELQMKKALQGADSLRAHLDRLKTVDVAGNQAQSLSEVLVNLKKAQLAYDELQIARNQAMEAGSGEVQGQLLTLEEIDSAIEEISNSILVLSDRAQTEVALDSANDKVKQLLVKHREIVNAEQEQANKQSGVTKQIRKTTESVNELRKATEKVRKASNKTQDSMSQGFKNVRGIIKKSIGALLAYGLGIRGLFALFSKLRSAITEGFKNLDASKISEYTQQIKELKASVSTMKNALAGAFEPIVTTVLPYLQRLVEWLTLAIDKMAQFIAALRGQKTYIKAIKQLGSAIEEAGNKAKGSLAGFDKLNNMTSDSGSGSGGGAGGLFQEVPISNDVLDKLEKMKDILDKVKKTADTIIVQPFKKGFNAVFPDWKEKIDEIKESWDRLMDAFKDLYDKIDWSKVEKALQSVFELIGAITGLIAKISLILANSIIQSVAKWLENNSDKIAQDVGEVSDSIASINGNIVEILSKIGEIFEVFDSDAATDFFAACLDVLYELVEEPVEFALKVINDLLTYINEKFDEEKVKAIKDALTTMFEILAPIVQGVADGIEKFWENVNKAYEFIKSDIIPIIEEFKTNVEEKIIAKFQELKDWIAENEDKWIEWKELFVSIWEDDIKPVVEDLKALWEAFAETWRVAWEEILKPFIEWVKKNVGPLIDEIKTKLDNFKKKVLEPIYNWIVEKVYPKIHEISIKIYTIVKWLLDTLKTFVIEPFFTILTAGFETLTALMEGDIPGALQTMKDAFYNVINPIKEWWNDLTSTISNTWDNTLGKLFNLGGQTFSIGFSGAKSGIFSGVNWHASGGVIPPTASPHFVGVGDNNIETEVISPLSTIEQALRNVMSEQNINVTFEVQGDPNRIFNVVRKESQTFNKSHGYSAFA